MARKNEVDEEILEDEFLDGEEPQSEEWINEEEFEGQLAVDVYQTKDKIIVKAPIAGVKPEDIDVAISEDVVTIRGDRKDEFAVEKDNYYVQECFWGSFSRSVILPASTVAEKADASLKDGVLTIQIPKVVQEDKVKKIKVSPA
ncbi:MAG: Hsp20/alpha crystallin family protein [Patescibacteria group bacterium]|jgi:HSP20 family protein|nr:Hsp20/alpha crystallin family protein [Patescibacteria group bacterium]